MHFEYIGYSTWIITICIFLSFILLFGLLLFLFVFETVIWKHRDNIADPGIEPECFLKESGQIGSIYIPLIWIQRRLGDFHISY